jgi:hypothetical protein
MIFMHLVFQDWYELHREPLQVVELEMYNFMLH